MERLVLELLSIHITHRSSGTHVHTMRFVTHPSLQITDAMEAQLLNPAHLAWIQWWRNMSRLSHAEGCGKMLEFGERLVSFQYLPSLSADHMAWTPWTTSVQTISMYIGSSTCLTNASQLSFSGWLLNRSHRSAKCSTLVGPWRSRFGRLEHLYQRFPMLWWWLPSDQASRRTNGAKDDVGRIARELVSNEQ